MKKKKKKVFKPDHVLSRFASKVTDEQSTDDLADELTKYALGIVNSMFPTELEEDKKQAVQESIFRLYQAVQSMRTRRKPMTNAYAYTVIEARNWALLLEGMGTSTRESGRITPRPIHQGRGRQRCQLPTIGSRASWRADVNRRRLGPNPSNRPGTKNGRLNGPMQDDRRTRVR